MLVGPAKALYMDEISTGLDSSTTFQIVRFMKQMVHIMDVTMIISLLQPAPETYDLFDDIILLSEGKIVYQGPRENVLEFFESVGFKCPERKGVADFLQEVTSRKDQQQYWCRKNEPYQYISVPEFVEHFNSFHIGQKLDDELRIPYDKSKAHPAALVKEKYGISNWELFKACFAREWLLMKRNSFVYIFKTTQITIMSVIAFTVFFRTKMKAGHISNGVKFYGALFFSLINVMFNGMAELALTIFRLPVFFKQRDFLFYPAWAFALPIWVLRIPLSLLESGIWIILTYYTIGFAPAASRYENAQYSVTQNSSYYFPACGLCQSIIAFLFQVFPSILGVLWNSPDGSLSLPLHCCSWKDTGCSKHTWYLYSPGSFCPWWICCCQRLVLFVFKLLTLLSSRNEPFPNVFGAIYLFMVAWIVMTYKDSQGLLSLLILLIP